jgi:pimeloyl-ACP methyl ester carboxylesterase
VTWTIWTELLGSKTGYLGSKYRTRAIEAGDGRPLLLLHGVGSHAEAFARNVVRLGGRYRAMAIDLLWHGFSSKPEFTGDAIGGYLGQLIDLLDSEGIDRAHLEGESLGGWVAMAFALAHPDRVGKLVLNTTAGIAWQAGSEGEEPATRARGDLRARSLAAIENPTQETIRTRLEWLMASPDSVTDELVEVRRRIYADPATNAALRTIFANSFGHGSGASARIPQERLADITAPTLVLWSDHNPGSGPDVGRRIAKLIGGAEFYCIAGSAHWPQWERPAEHDQVVLEFLGGDA